jgi:hypothetical protein
MSYFMEPIVDAAHQGAPAAKIMFFNHSEMFARLSSAGCRRRPVRSHNASKYAIPKPANELPPIPARRR